MSRAFAGLGAVKIDPFKLAERLALQYGKAHPKGMIGCEAVSQVVAEGLREAGVVARDVTGEAKYHDAEEDEDVEDFHSWVQINVDGKWKVFDPKSVILKARGYVWKYWGHRKEAE